METSRLRPIERNWQPGEPQRDADRERKARKESACPRTEHTVAEVRNKPMAINVSSKSPLCSSLPPVDSLHDKEGDVQSGQGSHLKKASQQSTEVLPNAKDPSKQGDLEPRVELHEEGADKSREEPPQRRNQQRSHQEEKGAGDRNGRHDYPGKCSPRARSSCATAAWTRIHGAIRSSV